MRTPHLHPPQLQTGHRGLDDEHEALLRLAEALGALPDDRLPSAFEDLRLRFAEHFAEEDGLMAHQDFPSRQCHLDEHAAVLASFAQVGALLAAGRHQPARTMAAELVRWLPGHIDALDRHLVKVLFFRRTGGAPLMLHR